VNYWFAFGAGFLAGMATLCVVALGVVAAGMDG